MSDDKSYVSMAEVEQACAESSRSFAGAHVNADRVVADVEERIRSAQRIRSAAAAALAAALSEEPI